MILKICRKTQSRSSRQQKYAFPAEEFAAISKKSSMDYEVCFLKYTI
jgi:hypothetical protein